MKGRGNYFAEEQRESRRRSFDEFLIRQRERVRRSLQRSTRRVENLPEDPEEFDRWSEELTSADDVAIMIRK